MQTIFNLTREQSDRVVLHHGRQPRTRFNFHSTLEFFFLQEGKADVWINDQHASLKAGELAIALSYDSHAYQGTEDAKCSYLFIPTHLCGEFFSRIDNRRPKTPFIRDRAVFDQLTGYSEAIEQAPNQLMANGYISFILGTVLEQLEWEERQEGAQPEDNRALFYLNEHFRKPLTLQNVAEALGYNPSYLSRYFKAHFHIGFNQYLTMLRLREAVLLMKDKKNTIDFCALESGFNSTRTFYRAFEREFHCSPGEYLRQQK